MRSITRTTAAFLAVAVIVIAVSSFTAAFTAKADSAGNVITESELADKIKGAWAGQMAGVMWAEDTEFKALGNMLDPDDVPEWTASMINGGFEQDDLYVEIPFIETMRDNGVYCDISLLASAFANTSFPLWHANNAARINLKNGIPAPDSGSYENNSHCDDIDWQIESDFIGQMCPGLVNEAIALAWNTGHIMNYGDGVYGGVFVAAMHAAAFTAASVDEIIEAGRLSVPEGSKFRRVVEDIINWKENGNTYSQTWALLQSKWGDVDRCPNGRGDGNPLNIDAKLNAGYCLIGLLYGGGDFEESMRIAMLCGQDSDCNASTVGGILGNYYGFSALPEKWTSGLDTTKKFYCSETSLEAALALNMQFAKEVLAKNGIASRGGAYTIPAESEIIPPVLEQWKEQPLLEVATKVGRMNIEATADATDPSGIRSYVWDFGDGSTGSGRTVTHTYTNPGTYSVSCTVTSNADTETVVTVKLLVDNNIAAEGTPFVSQPSPQGNGSRDINIICDGVMPTAATGDFKLQYDTYAGVYSTEGYVGYTFENEVSFDTVVFQEGYHFADGGWFADGTLKLQVRQNGEWVDIDADVSPAYPASDNYWDFGDPLEIFTFTFDAVTGDGVRLYGRPGGVWNFFSISELRVLAPVPQAETLGDFDGDGNVTSDDAVYLLRHTLFAAQYPIDGYADFDHDSAVTSDDAIFLLRHTLFPAQYVLAVKNA